MLTEYLSLYLTKAMERTYNKYDSDIHVKWNRCYR